jgi:hypothetical protein
LTAARSAVFPSVPWQRSRFHLQQNAQANVTRLDLRATITSDIRSIFNYPNLVTSALLCEISEEWITGTIYFNMIRPPYPKAVRHFCRIKIAPPKFMRDFEGFFSLYFKYTCCVSTCEFLAHLSYARTGSRKTDD